MDSLKTQDGNTVHTQEEILEEQVKFYKDVYKKKKEFNEEEAKAFTHGLNIPQLTPEQKDILETPFNVDELANS
jgi:hypothetical protein